MRVFIYFVVLFRLLLLRSVAAPINLPPPTPVADPIVYDDNDAVKGPDAAELLTSQV